MIFCDGGLEHQKFLNVQPDLIVGDFDSFEKPETETEMIVLPCEKDDTDTFFAVKEAVSRGYEEFLLLGTAGARLDHTFGNISILLYLDSIGKKGMLVDDYSEMEILSQKPSYIDNSFAYFSLLAVSGPARGITIKNAKYPLENGEISCEYQYGISNQVLPEKTAVVTVNDGKLLLIKVR